MTLSPGAKLQPLRSTLRSPAGLSAACSSMLKRTGPNAAAIHRAQHLGIADRIEAESLRNPRLHQIDDPRHGRFGVVRLHEIEVAVATWLGEIGNGALIDLVRAGDDPALRCLPDDSGQPQTAPEAITSART